MNGQEFGLRLGNWKYIEGPKTGKQQLFNLQDDPGETRNVFMREKHRAVLLQRRVAAWRRGAPFAKQKPEDLSEEERQGLRALGYID